MSKRTYKCIEPQANHYKPYHYIHTCIFYNGINSGNENYIESIGEDKGVSLTDFLD